jgi:Glycosyltransferase like family 2
MRITSMVTAEQQLSVRHHPCGAVVICTKDRPDEIEMSCAAAHRASPNMPILVVDASATEATRHVCEGLARQLGPSSKLLYRRARQPGLARQRSEAVEVCHELGVEVVHFIDDDTEVSTGYFNAIERRFLQDPTVMGLGGVIVNQPIADHLTIRSIFLLCSRRRGTVLRSGRNTLSQYPGTHASDRVDWLSGCSMSYRITAFKEIMFDGRLEGSSLGEDYDFSFRLSRKHKLAVEPLATCIHHLTPTARSSMRANARQSTQTTYRWVRENRALGMSRAAFWWSTLGDVVFHATPWILRGNPDALQETLGVLEAVSAIARNRSTSVNLGDAA